ncbi:dephospho-CoA kinase [Luminiphilus sp.]|jgi:dephospho-CoA kinase|nr:dephospho-CoA kinase [Luminiphilus sp.]MDA8619824.1 dephospho-CoA kinase [Luminiphilus sp.]MDB2688793.1 dephospho-CoA kinase [Luminiphilus sp.]MDC0572664.1 dephospho-CoA kinase [Luminiphilus sp.]MDC6471425.1 dephospho-CoA kinase [Luminiphilus sp.]
MLRVGVTGGIGSGKTALTDWLTEKGITVVDADLAARVVVAPGQPALADIIAAFGDEYLLPDGQLNRAALRKLVFEDADKRKALEAMTHSRIREELIRQLAAADSAYVVLSSPLLLESGQSELIDVSVVVDAPEATQIARTMERDGNDQALVEGIMAAQLDRETRKSRADIVIDNSASLTELHEQATILHQTLLARATNT